MLAITMIYKIQLTYIHAVPFWKTFTTLPLLHRGENTLPKPGQCANQTMQISRVDNKLCNVNVYTPEENGSLNFF